MLRKLQLFSFPIRLSYFIHWFAQRRRRRRNVKWCTLNLYIQIYAYHFRTVSVMVKLFYYASSTRRRPSSYMMQSYLMLCNLCVFWIYLVTFYAGIYFTSFLFFFFFCKFIFIFLFLFWRDKYIYSLWQWASLNLMGLCTTAQHWMTPFKPKCVCERTYTCKLWAVLEYIFRIESFLELTHNRTTK